MPINLFPSHARLFHRLPFGLTLFVPISYYYAEYVCL